VAELAPELLELAESANVFVPLAPRDERIATDRWVIWIHFASRASWAAAVQRFRLEPDEVESAVAEIRRLFDERGRPARSFEVGSSSTPADLGERLLALGMTPDPNDHELSAMVLTEPPRGPLPEGVEARPVAGLAEYLATREVVWEAFGATEEERAAELHEAPAYYEEEAALGLAATFGAWLGGELVATGNATFTPHGALLFAGATLPRARGRGAYRALVQARWDEAVRRGTPALITQAGVMSRPILAGLGFREVARIRKYIDVASGA
jgi:hypothetical protein